MRSADPFSSPDADDAALPAIRRLSSLGRFSEALGLVVRGLDATPDVVALLVERARLLRSMGALDAAESAIGELAQRQPDHPDLSLLRAELATATQDPAIAERAYTDRLRADPANPQAQARLARCLSQSGRHAEALQLLSCSLAETPSARPPMIERVRVLSESGQKNEAAEALRAFAALYPNHPKVANLRAALAEASGDWIAAEEAHALAVAAHPEDVRARLRWVRVLIRRGRTADAEAALAAGFAAAPDCVELLLAQTGLLLKVGHHAGADRLIEGLLRLQPDHPQLGRLRADLAEAVGDLEKAERICCAEVRAHPSDIVRRLRWVRQLVRLDRRAEALQALDRGLVGAPGELRMWAEKAAILIAQGQWLLAEQALAVISASAAGQPRLIELRAQLAQARGDPETATSLYAGDAAAHPGDAERRRRWLRSLQQSGRIAEALAAFDAQAPVGLSEWRLWLTCLLEAGRWSEADAALERWPHRDARGELARLDGLMDLALMRLDHPGVLKHARAALALAPQSHHITQTLARAAACQFQTDLAWDTLAEVRIRGVTGGGPARRGIGRLRHLVGQMVNEFRLRPEATAALAAAVLRGDADLMATAAAQVRADPDSFAAALGLMSGLARSGAFARGAEPGAGSDRIPRHLHQFWDQPEAPPDVAQLMRRAAAVNADHVHRRWDDAAAFAHLGTIDVPGVQAAFRRAHHPAMRCDVFRLAVLYGSGGIYLDADDFCARPLASLIPPDADLVCYQENIGSIGNNFIAARPRHPVIGAALTEAIRTVLEGATETLWLVTGPGLFTRAVAAAVATLPDGALRDGRLPRALRVVPLDVFRSTVHTVRRASYKTDARSWKRVG